MVKRFYRGYANSFEGLSKEVWWLALITFINRAGTMVLPFLSLYLTADLKFSLAQVGTIMSFFGAGSLIGSWLGGKLTDKIGFYKVMFWSLFITGFLFIGLQFIHTFWGFAIGVFLTMLVADMFRPAMFVSLKAYSKPQNQTRSLTLIRLAINLGFSLGPFLGGLLIAGMGYSMLFWVDGITCILAILIMRWVLIPKPFFKDAVKESIENVNKAITIYKDKAYLIFLGVIFIMGFIFMQLFTTMPLYYKEVHQLTEVEIGLLMALNGFLVFLLEMPLIHFLERRILEPMKIITWSLVLLSLSYVVLNFSSWNGILIIGIVFITFGEMLAFPFSNHFAINRAPLGKEGRYMAFYSMAFSLSHVFTSKTGMEVIARFGYDINWYLMGVLGLIAIGLIFWLKQTLISEKNLA